MNTANAPFGTHPTGVNTCRQKPTYFSGDGGKEAATRAKAICNETDCHCISGAVHENPRSISAEADL